MWVLIHMTSVRDWVHVPLYAYTAQYCTSSHAGVSRTSCSPHRDVQTQWVKNGQLATTTNPHIPKKVPCNLHMITDISNHKNVSIIDNIRRQFTRVAYWSKEDEAQLRSTLQLAQITGQGRRYGGSIALTSQAPLATSGVLVYCTRTIRLPTSTQINLCLTIYSTVGTELE